MSIVKELKNAEGKIKTLEAENSRLRSQLSAATATAAKPPAEPTDRQTALEQYGQITDANERAAFRRKHAALLGLA